MAYSVDLRERVVAYRKEGHTREETREVFRVSTTAIKNWEKQLSETGNLEKAPLHREPTKFKSEKLCAYIRNRVKCADERFEIRAAFGANFSSVFATPFVAKIQRGTPRRVLERNSGRFWRVNDGSVLRVGTRKADA